MNGSVVPANGSSAPVQGFIIFTVASFCISITSVLVNTISVTVIATNKKFRSPCFTLIAGGEIGSFLFATSFVIGVVDRLGRSFGLFPIERTGITCIVPGPLVSLLANMYHVLVTISIALDRLASIFLPIRYRLWGKRYPFCVLGVCASFAVGQLIVGIATAELNCSFGNNEMANLHPLYMRSYTSGNLCLCVLVVVVYSAMWIGFRFRCELFDVGNLPDREQFMKQQVSVMPTIKLMALLYLITNVPGEALMMAGAVTTDEAVAVIINGCGLILKNASTLVESFALLLRNRVFREACKTLLGWKTNEVAPAGNRTRLNRDDNAQRYNRGLQGHWN